MASKDITLQKTKKDGEFAHLLIPTIDYSNFKSFYTFLKEHQQIVMKSKMGQGGAGVYKLSKGKNKYTLSYKNSEENITKRHFKETLDDKPYIFQNTSIPRLLRGIHSIAKSA
ncbi:YheC/YheD family protein [Virgibacillus natechei]